MAVYHTPITLTRSPQAIGPFTDKVTCQPRGGDIYITDLATITAGQEGVRVAEGGYFDLPIGETIRAWSTGAANVRVVMMKALG